jgi:hypothetical protein
LASHPAFKRKAAGVSRRVAVLCSARFFNASLYVFGVVSDVVHYQANALDRRVGIPLLP